MKDFIRINPKDNVVIALTDLTAGLSIELDRSRVTLAEAVPRGHKIALAPITAGADVIKYGMPIGHALADIAPGQHVHVHNLKTNLGELDSYHYNPHLEPVSVDFPGRTVNVYRRANGEVGIRNELWIVPTVGCVNGIGELIVNEFKQMVDISAIDGINVLKHPYGCSQLGSDHVNTRTILQDAVRHPNTGGVLVLGLGCENNQVDEFRATLGEYDPERVRFLVTQMVGDEIEAGVAALTELYEVMRHDRREAADISELKLGLECGGSDGLSGITANPLLGELSDYLIAHGGTTVLTEVPEMFGAETLLMERCADVQVFEKTVHLINDFKEYFMRHDQEIYENPSPGNKRGGITTLEDKSLGCTQKSGRSPVVDVLKYGEVIRLKGLNLVSAPGNDLVATSALAAAGCHMVLFSTGRGTPYGGFVPTIKLSTNTEIYLKKPRWIDFNAGSLVEDKDMPQLLTELIDYVVRVANGELTNNEKNNFREIAIFKGGVTL
jgi:altronate hydrolase